METASLKKFNYYEHIKGIESLCEDYPFLQKERIGKSVMGRDIHSLTIGNADEYALFLGGIRGTEGFSCGLLLNFVSKLCKSLAEDSVIYGLKSRRALSGRGLVIVPCVNPDGCEIASLGKAGCGNRFDKIKEFAKCDFKNYRLNARGVDIDLNFFDKPISYEAETTAVADLLKKTPIRHSVVFGWGAGGIITTQGETMSRSSRMAEIMSATTGYDVLAENTGYSGGFARWFSDSYIRPSFRVQIPNYTESEDDGYIKTYKELYELMMLCAIM